MKKIILAAAVALSFGQAALASSIPVSLGADSRVQAVSYNANDVVMIHTRAGVVTDIILEPDEVYLTHAFGDATAWHFSTYGNHVFIKPAVVNGDTNLVLVTNKRTYNFSIIYSATPENTVYQVKFTYPDTIKKNAELAKESSLLDNTYKGKMFNLSYEMSGDKTIAPINVWDDGTFTYFKFAGNTDLPAIYTVLATDSNGDGNEAIVNRTVTGSSNNIIVMHKVNPKWRLRLGNSVLDVFNKNMNWRGVDNTTGTISPDVKRVIVGGNANE
jgi:type IV secretion system protein VirB9